MTKLGKTATQILNHMQTRFNRYSGTWATGNGADGGRRTSGGAELKLNLSPGKRLLSLPSFAAVVNPEARAALEARLPAFWRVRG